MNTKKDVLKIKAQLLTEGCNISNEVQRLFEKQNPSKVRRGGLSSGGKFYLQADGNEILVNAPFYNKRETALKLRLNPKNKKEIVVVENDKVLVIAKIMEAPDWYNQTVQGFPITQILTQHGNQLAGSIYEDCALFSLKKECKFCVINRSVTGKNPQLLRKSPKLILATLDKIPLEDYAGLTLNGGMTLHAGRGMEFFEPVIRQIKEKYPQLSIGIEITPPTDLNWINRLANVGLDSLMMNLETWDPKIRAKILPGKNEYCSRESYFKAFERGIEVLGSGKVSTCFVVGTEPIESLKKGINAVIEMGVVPSPLSGRYFEDIPNYPFLPDVDWKDFYQVFQFAKLQMKLENLKTTDKAGCVACTGCDLIRNFVD